MPLHLYVIFFGSLIIETSFNGESYLSQYGNNSSSLINRACPSLHINKLRRFHRFLPLFHFRHCCLVLGFFSLLCSSHWWRFQFSRHRCFHLHFKRLLRSVPTSTSFLRSTLSTAADSSSVVSYPAVSNMPPSPSLLQLWL